MNTPRPRTTLNIIFEDRVFENNKLNRNLFTNATNQDSSTIDLNKGPMNFRYDLYQTYLQGLHQISAVNFPDVKRHSQIKFIRSCLDLIQPVLAKFRSMTEGHLDVGVKFHIAQKFLSSHYAQQNNIDIEEVCVNAWILDTDGLDLSLDLLNMGRAISVFPLCPFFDILNPDLNRNNKQGNVFKRPRVNWYRQHQFPNQDSNDFSNNGADHFLILVHPNLEPFVYDTTDKTKEGLLEKFNQESIRSFKRQNGEIIEIEEEPHHALVNSSYLSRSVLHEMPHRVVFRPDNQVRNRIHQYLFSDWDGGNLTEVFSESLSVEEFMDICELKLDDGTILQDNILRNNLLSGAIYLKKHNANRNLNRKTFYARDRSVPLSENEIQDTMTLVKWTVHSYQENGRYNSNWTLPNVCNAPVQVNGQVEFCKNIVNNSLRCDGCNELMDGEEE